MEGTTATVTQEGHRVLSQEQIDSFAMEGYLRVGKLLTDEEIELLRSEHDREFALARAGHGAFRNLSANPDEDHDDHDHDATNGDKAGSKKPVKQEMLQIMQMCERNIHF